MGTEMGTGVALDTKVTTRNGDRDGDRDGGGPRHRSDTTRNGDRAQGGPGHVGATTGPRGQRCPQVPPPVSPIRGGWGGTQPQHRLLPGFPSNRCRAPARLRAEHYGMEVGWRGGGRVSTPQCPPPSIWGPPTVGSHHHPGVPHSDPHLWSPRVDPFGSHHHFRVPHSGPFFGVSKSEPALGPPHHFRAPLCGVPSPFWGPTTILASPTQTRFWGLPMWIHFGVPPPF